MGLHRLVQSRSPSDSLHFPTYPLTTTTLPPAPPFSHFMSSHIYLLCVCNFWRKLGIHPGTSSGLYWNLNPKVRMPLPENIEYPTKIDFNNEENTRRWGRGLTDFANSVRLQLRILQIFLSVLFFSSSSFFFSIVGRWLLRPQALYHLWQLPKLGGHRSLFHFLEGILSLKPSSRLSRVSLARDVSHASLLAVGMELL